MRNNSLYNINQNKMLEDQLSNQMTNQSKIVRPVSYTHLTLPTKA